jgi:hypothetical protein
MSIRPSFGAVVPNKADYKKLRRPKNLRALPQRLQAEGSVSLDEAWRHHWPTRDQFGRGTCVAFGAIAAIELMWAREVDLPPERLSEQFLNERMLSTYALRKDERATIPDGGLLLRQAWQVIENQVLVDAERVPYRPAAHGLAPAGPEATQDILTAAQSQRFTCLSYGRVGVANPNDNPRTEFFVPANGIAQKFLDSLKDGYPVVIGVPLFVHVSGLTNWTLPSALSRGVIYCPEDADAPAIEGPREDGHVVCLTGFVLDSNEPLGGWFTFRNSWGAEFAARALGDVRPNASTGRGNGTISATHVNEYCWEYLVPGPNRGGQWRRRGGDLVQTPRYVPPYRQAGCKTEVRGLSCPAA